MTSNWKRLAELALISPGAPRVVTIQDLQSYAMLNAGRQPSASALTRWVRSLNETGKLQQVTRGVYLNRLAGPSVHPAEASQYIRRGAVVSLAWVLERSGALSNFGDTVTCVVPQGSDFSPPRVGERQTTAGPFRFYALPIAVLNAGRENIEDVQDLHFAYPRATPERALLDWIYLGASVRSRLSLPPVDIQLHQMNRPRLKRLAGAMGIARQWAAWLERWNSYQGAEDVRQNASAVLGL
ncbi:MAG: hypothetical protein A3H91_06280 [Gammaproteobacteria bacterium RIFCSPLOWO2_02_FULL_61_13]|nr:MAG: hypothetical protein A3H91_06280 [Gammaproteobacteria bacterium RIFCSPLOWO2_02_FULL_61_13]